VSFTIHLSILILIRYTVLRMPRCEGRPDGPCPEKKNDASVHGSHGHTPQVRDVKASTEMAHTLRAEVVSSNDPPAAARDPLAAPTAGTTQPNDIKYVVNEMVSYIYHYHNSCSQAAMLKVVSGFYSAAALVSMQSAVLAMAIPSVRLSVRLSHAGTLSRRMKLGSCGFHCEVAKTL